MDTRATRIGLGIASALVIAFLWVPILIILAYAFNGSALQTWPIQNLTLHWFHEAWTDQEARDALWLSVKIGLIATSVALVLGTAASFAISAAMTSVSEVVESAIPSAASSSRSSWELVRFPLWPSVTTLDRPCWTIGWAFVQWVDPVVE